MRVKIREWSSICYWNWNGCELDDLCGICQNNFDSSCPTCTIPGDDCPLSLVKYLCIMMTLITK